MSCEKNRRADPPTGTEIDRLRAEGAPLSLVCRALGLSRAGFYKWQHGSAPTPPRQEPCDQRLAQRIRSILDREETFGYRRVWAWLRFQEGVMVNRKTVHRIMQRHGWQCRLWHRPAVRPKPTWERCSTVDQPDRLWATDTTKVWCGRDGWASFVGVLDAGSRECVGARFARRGRAIEAVDALEQGIVHRYGCRTQAPEGLRLRHDTGSVFLARLFVGTTQQLAITQEFIPRSSPEYNGVIERFFRTLKQAGVWLHHFESFEQAERVILAWIDRYNTERQHSALGSLSPRAWREQFYQVPQAAYAVLTFRGALQFTLNQHPADAVASRRAIGPGGYRLVQETRAQDHRGWDCGTALPQPRR